MLRSLPLLSSPLHSHRTGRTSTESPTGGAGWGALVEKGEAVSQERQAWPQAVDPIPHWGLHRATPGELAARDPSPHSPWSLRKARLLVDLCFFILCWAIGIESINGRKELKMIYRGRNMIYRHLIIACLSMFILYGVEIYTTYN